MSSSSSSCDRFAGGVELHRVLGEALTAVLASGRASVDHLSVARKYLTDTCPGHRGATASQLAELRRLYLAGLLKAAQQDPVPATVLLETRRYLESQGYAVHGAVSDDPEEGPAGAPEAHSHPFN